MLDCKPPPLSHRTGLKRERSGESDGLLAATKRVGMDVTAAHPAEEVGHLLRQRNLLPLHKEDAFVLERTRPVHVNLELTANVLGDDQQLGKS